MSKITLELMAREKRDIENKPIAPFEIASNCPFCGGDNITIRNQDNKIFWMACMDCDSNGPNRMDRRNAIGIWNRRP